MQSEAAVDRYIREIRAIPRLTRAQEHELAVAAQNGDASAADKLVRANMRYAVAIALKHRRYGIGVAELIAEGNVGLATAVKKFDPSRGTRFVTYAGYWIRAFVLEAVVRNATLVDPGSGPFRSKLYFRLRRERARLSNAGTTRESLVSQLAALFETSEKRMEVLLSRLDSRELSLDTPVGDQSGTLFVDTIRSEDDGTEESVAAAEERNMVRDRLQDALSALDERERVIVERRILRDEGESLASLGRLLGVSRERARQLESRAKSKLRRELQDLAPAA